MLPYVLVQPEMERGPSPLVGIPHFGRGLSLSQAAPLRSSQMKVILQDAPPNGRPTRSNGANQVCWHNFRLPRNPTIDIANRQITFHKPLPVLIRPNFHNPLSGQLSRCADES